MLFNQKRMKYESYRSSKPIPSDSRRFDSAKEVVIILWSKPFCLSLLLPSTIVLQSKTDLFGFAFGSPLFIHSHIASIIKSAPSTKLDQSSIQFSSLQLLTSNSSEEATSQSSFCTKEANVNPLFLRILKKTSTLQNLREVGRRARFPFNELSKVENRRRSR